eukprot:Plantae.Rhodophyta-Purpureofilum_apyrenoidigerum.ctg9975.p1 GENE.Plantae.Rhodophyta-Purpureofilum_apyrenoidigerum.ctg9975~~Plantae.Rhodophyta-Purpureofilum_apyrenoidigerum.ctg9975.p1  ORF type:complete len:224 (+),score=26.83 Plantae.Rhodophyta-Purpureofilum_apyrenoidigerum.ctg9975:202-873(+)
MDAQKKTLFLQGYRRMLLLSIVFWYVIGLRHRLVEVGKEQQRVKERSGGVCGLDGRNYASVDEARRNDTAVLHVDGCGACSNVHDVGIYENTKLTLTTSTALCGALYLFTGDSAAEICMDKAVGFTETCKQCWMENLRCTTTSCGGLCLKHVVTSLFTGTNISRPNLDGSLNACLDCDERLCGPRFKNCAGATRRRSGIESDILRHDSEIAKDAIYSSGFLTL